MYLTTDAVYIRSLSYAQIGLVLSSALWGITSLQAFAYYRKFKSDTVLVKVAVGVVWFADTMYVILEATSQYQIMRGTFTFSLILSTIVLTAVMQSAVQMVYALRLYILTHQLWIPLVCCTGAAYEFIAIVLYGVLILNDNFPVNQIKYRWIITSTYITCPIVDAIITVTFCYQLMKDRQYIRQRTKRIVDKLVLWTIQSGLITSLTAIAIVIMDFALQDSNPLFLVLTVMISSLYPVTLLALLNARSHLRSMNEKANDELSASFNLGAHTEDELHPGKSIPINVPIGQQATDSADTTSTIPTDV
ncbi:hypothetical protein M378DRAFT_15372 [Amanita muscaria Koide BX008]|uniref:DUF6534 domain-containing protein n=1 Tax=Amanita muscaria (strain Koide BX008) TaxID=946122 RepID=A0A0C2WBL5_AMAMK|nr:hypothetical protein M378DRAFT_15372 [Amanita muscaria Koide BX008]